MIVLLYNTHSEHSIALHAQGVLAHRDHVPVLQDRLELRTDGVQLVGHQQRGGQHGPQRHLGLALVDRQPVVTDDELNRKLYTFCNTANDKRFRAE